MPYHAGHKTEKLRSRHRCTTMTKAYRDKLINSPSQTHWRGTVCGGGSIPVKRTPMPDYCN